MILFKISFVEICPRFLNVDDGKNEGATGGCEEARREDGGREGAGD